MTKVYALEQVEGDGRSSVWGIYTSAVWEGVTLERSRAYWGSEDWTVLEFAVNQGGYGYAIRFAGPTRDELKAAGWRGW